MTPVSFDHMNLTAETDKHINGDDIEDVLLWKIHQGEIEVGWLVLFPNHMPSIRFRTSVIDNIVLARRVKPSTLHLNLCESAADIEHQVVRKIVSDRPENTPSVLERLKNGRLFGYVTALFCVHA